MVMDQKEKFQVILRFSRRYGLSSFTHPHTPRYQCQIDRSANSRCVRSKPVPSCLLERLPESILQDILSRLPIPELLMAQQSCADWHRIVSSCPIFQRLYDDTNQHESWIALALTSNFLHIPDGLEGFVLFNTNYNMDGLYNFLSVAQNPAAPMATGWLLQGVADGLMLLASTEGRLLVLNPLTRHFRQLPTVKLSSRLSLESCLKKNFRHPHDSPSITINIVVDSASTTFKVMLLGEMRMEQVHVLIYSSLTDTWTIKLCSEIDHRLFRRFFHTTLHGNSIYCASIHPRTINFNSIYPRWLVSYNTETHLSVVEEIPVMELSAIQDTGLLRVQTIGIVNYKNRIFLLGVIAGYHQFIQWKPFSVVALWEANPSAGEWKVLTTTPLEWVTRYCIDFWACELAVAYDGERSVTIIASSGSIRTILLGLNLDTEEWSMVWNDNIATEIINSSILAPKSGSNKNKGLKAFHIKLKFCTAT